MKTNKFLTSALFCALVAGLVACNSNNPTGGTTATQDFDLVKVCNSCSGKSLAEVQEIMKPYGLTSTLDEGDDFDKYLYYIRYGKNNIPIVQFVYIFENGLCRVAEGIQTFESREEGRKAYFDNYFPAEYHRTIDRLASDITTYDREQINDWSSGLYLYMWAWDGDPDPYYDHDDDEYDIQMFDGDGSIDGIGWIYCNRNDCFSNFGDDYTIVPWTTEQLFSQIKKDADKNIAFCKEKSVLQEKEHEQYRYEIFSNTDETIGWDKGLYFQDGCFDEYTELYIDNVYSILYVDIYNFDARSSSAETPLKNSQSGKRHAPHFSSFRK